MKNQELRTYAKSKKVCFWEVAEKLGICEATMTKRLRHELPPEEKAQIFAIIDEISAEKKSAV